MNLQQSAYALDSTTIDLCLHLFPWARFRRRKAAVKLHMLLDLRGNIPCFTRITYGKTHDVIALGHLLLEPETFYVMDKGYVVFARLGRFARCAAFFIARAKKNIDYTCRTAHRLDKKSGARSRPHYRPPQSEDISTVSRILAWSE